MIIKLMQALYEVLKNSTVQFIYTFGTLLIAGILLTWISRWTQRVFQQFKFPKFGLYFFGIVGIPLHEFGHALFAKLFFHKIEKIKWFDPKAKGASYGSVVHAYEEKNFLHRLGLFFIGMGPVLLTPVLVYLCYRFFVPNAVSFQQLSAPNPLASLNLFALSFLHLENWQAWPFYLFLYFTICITSQMELSPDDFKIARGGILPFFSLFFLANLIALILKIDLHRIFLSFVDKTMVGWIGLFALAICVALVNFVGCFILMSVFNKLTGAKSIQPF